MSRHINHELISPSLLIVSRAVYTTVLVPLFSQKHAFWGEVKFERKIVGLINKCGAFENSCDSGRSLDSLKIDLDNVF